MRKITQNLQLNLNLALPAQIFQLRERGILRGKP